MMTLLAIVFGIAAILSAGVIIAWAPVLRNGADRRFKTIATGMLIATTGVLVLCLNRVSVALLGNRLDLEALLVAGVLILIGKLLWLIGAERGRGALQFAGVLAIAWTVFVLVMFG